MPSVVIVGAGAIGLSAAYHLSRSGCEVTVIDPAPLAAKASGHNAGWLIPSMSTPVPAPGMMGQALRWIMKRDSPLYVTPSLDPRFVDFMLRMLRSCTHRRFREGSATLSKLSADALAAFDELIADGVRFEMHEQPLTMLFTDPHKVEARVNDLELLDGKLPGFSWRHMNPADLRKHLPALSDKVVAGIESEGDRTVDPTSFVHGLADACRKEGVELNLGSSASLVDTGRGVVVRVDGETIRADKIVVAAGAWSNRVLAGIGERVPLVSGKGYGYDYPVGFGGPTKPFYLAEAKVAITPLDTKIRLAGTMGFTEIDERIGFTRAQGILGGVNDYFAGWPEVADAPEPWTGLRPMSPDGIPYVGPLLRHPQVLLATGHVMLGISLAPVTGRLIADLVMGRTRAESIPKLLPSRF
nr:FAD-dependent oxidoreductase [Brevibacterium zhoupengii]